MRPRPLARFSHIPIFIILLFAFQAHSAPSSRQQLSAFQIPPISEPVTRTIDVRKRTEFLRHTLANGWVSTSCPVSRHHATNTMITHRSDSPLPGHLGDLPHLQLLEGASNPLQCRPIRSRPEIISRGPDGPSRDLDFRQGPIILQSRTRILPVGGLGYRHRVRRTTAPGATSDDVHLSYRSPGERCRHSS